MIPAPAINPLLLYLAAKPSLSAYPHMLTATMSIMEDPGNRNLRLLILMKIASYLTRIRNLTIALAKNRVLPLKPVVVLLL
jgi:hypothetical protein